MRNILGIPDLIRKVIRLGGLSNPAKIILLELICQATSFNNQGELESPTVPKRLADVVHSSRRSVTNYVKELENLGLVRRLHYDSYNVLFLINIEAIKGGKFPNVSNVENNNNFKNNINVENVEEGFQGVEGKFPTGEGDDGGGGCPAPSRIGEERESAGSDRVMTEVGSAVWSAYQRVLEKSRENDWRKRLVEELVQEFGDGRSRDFYTKLVERVSFQILDEARRITQSAMVYRDVRNPGAYFVGVIKKLIGIDGKFKVAKLGYAY
jgi:hypothetical protein